VGFSATPGVACGTGEIEYSNNQTPEEFTIKKFKVLILLENYGVIIVMRSILINIH